MTNISPGDIVQSIKGCHPNRYVNDLNPPKQNSTWTVELTGKGLEIETGIMAPVLGLLNDPLPRIFGRPADHFRKLCGPPDQLAENEIDLPLDAGLKAPKKEKV